jgi:hypothetical protein
MRFRCLDQTAGKLMFKPERACNIIVSCLVLHKISRNINSNDILYSEAFVDNNYSLESINETLNTNEGNIMRNNLVFQSFSH